MDCGTLGVFQLLPKKRFGSLLIKAPFFAAFLGELPDVHEILFAPNGQAVLHFHLTHNLYPWLELGPQLKIHVCLVSGKQRGPQKTKLSKRRTNSGKYRALSALPCGARSVLHDELSLSLRGHSCPQLGFVLSGKVLAQASLTVVAGIALLDFATRPLENHSVTVHLLFAHKALELLRLRALGASACAWLAQGRLGLGSGLVGLTPSGACWGGAWAGLGLLSASRASSRGSWGGARPAAVGGLFLLIRFLTVGAAGAVTEPARLPLACLLADAITAKAAQFFEMAELAALATARGSSGVNMFAFLSSILRRARLAERSAAGGSSSTSASSWRLRFAAPREAIGQTKAGPAGERKPGTAASN